MTFNVENLVRSAVVLVVGLPLTLSVAGLTNSASRLSEVSQADTVTASLKGELTGPCVRFMVTKEDSKAEREAQNEIDEIVGGDTNHAAVCKWVL